MRSTSRQRRGPDHGGDRSPRAEFCSAHCGHYVDVFAKRFRVWWNIRIWAITIVSATSFLIGLVFLGRFAIEKLSGV